MPLIAYELALLSVLLVLAQGMFSYCEGTFWFGQEGGDEKLKLPFLLHGGVVVGDLVLLPYAFFTWGPYLHVPLWLWVVFFGASIAITRFCHRAWWFACKDEPGFMYPNRHKSGGDENRWYQDLPVSARIHFVYMVWALVFIGEYIYTPMPTSVVLRTFWIFVALVPIAIIEPGIVQAWPPTRKSLRISLGITVVLWGVVWAVTVVKLIQSGKWFQ